jgi:transcriptional regulator with XRE-family HTH domain
MELHEHIREIRVLKGILQCHIAKQIHVSPSTYCRMESGRRTIKAELIQPLADALGVKPEDFFADSTPRIVD